MLYPENQKWVPKVKEWITDSLARTKTYNQRQLLTIDEVLNPCFSDPWGHNTINYAISLVDGYIMPTFPKDGVYEPLLDRYPMAIEATQEIVNFLETVSFDTDQSDELIRTHIQKLFSWLYAWNTELVWVDKVHPEDICVKVLFGNDPPTYAERAALVNNESPDFFLRGKDYYEIETWLTKIDDWSAFAVNRFPYQEESFSLYFPGQGYSFGKERAAFEMQSQARGIAYSLYGVMAKALTDKTKLTKQFWSRRLAVLTDAAVYCNPVLSYILRFDF
ncbi:hypothetical protein MOA67_gp166 [Klebsiella phage KpLz-2_45]|uniref:hypothetical protein n=1 Tax=Klebsiella phage KpLz-2_45 TaxID=2698923 RepID=UPI001F139299|nr:hypothetical protein MOA67_gp166 [Klebsiella phage KpLz-2_45]UKS72032.1 hypothetical protein KpLz245_1660 [Klebsiella phage KpLz-2_45]